MTDNVPQEAVQAAVMHVNCTKAEKGAYVAASRAEGKKLGEWVREILNRELQGK